MKQGRAAVLNHGSCPAGVIRSVVVTSAADFVTMLVHSIIIINEYYYSAIESKITSRALNNRKNKTNYSVTQDKNRSQTVRAQTSSCRAVSSSVSTFVQHSIMRAMLNLAVLR